MNLESPPLYDTFAAPELPEQASKFPKIVAGFNWLRWFQSLWAFVQLAPQRVSLVTLTLQSTSLGTTAVPMQSVPGGIYRLSTRVRVTRAGSVSSSIQVTTAWTEGSVGQTDVGTALNGNTTTTRESRTVVIHPAGATAISYSTVYADGGGAVKMQYSLDVILELLSKDQA